MICWVFLFVQYPHPWITHFIYFNSKWALQTHCLPFISLFSDLIVSRLPWDGGFPHLTHSRFQQQLISRSPANPLHLGQINEIAHETIQLSCPISLYLPSIITQLTSILQISRPLTLPAFAKAGCMMRCPGLFEFPLPTGGLDGMLGCCWATLARHWSLRSTTSSTARLREDKVANELKLELFVFLRRAAL